MSRDATASTPPGIAKQWPTLLLTVLLLLAFGTFISAIASSLWLMIFGRVASGELRVEIARTFPLSEAAAAHEFIESRQAFGRVVMTP